MAKPIALPSKTFPTQKAALDYFKRVLYAYELGEVVADPTHDALLRELSDRHPDATEKIGSGIAQFFINETSAGDYKFVSADARGIWIRRTDGSVVDWSYQTAIKKPGRTANVKDALRLAVNDRRVEKRDAAFAAGPVHCALTGVIIPAVSDADLIYRDPTWSELVDGFIASVGGWGNVETNSGFGESAIGGRLTDSSLVDRWLSYWDAHARPVLVMKDEGGRGPRA